MINEGLKILQEGKAQRASDIDVIWVNGDGWPRDKGGPMYYGDMIGAGMVLAKMEQLAETIPAFSPAQSLIRLADEGGSIFDL
jgi:3-hydroxyacyl-CoA dehydrogenase